MNRLLETVVVLALSATPLKAVDAPKAPKDPKAPASGEAFKTEEDRTIYAWGFRLGQNLAPVGFKDSELKAFTQGLRDGETGKNPAVRIDLYLPKVGELQQKRVAANNAAQAAPNKKKGAEFAEKFSKEDGVKPIHGGGFLKVIAQGSGAQPSDEDTVKVNYRGTLIDGTEFDSSYKRGEPATFPLKNVIPCWTNGVAAMKVGGKSKLVCPSDAAYGDNGHPPTIPSGATLVFEVELLEIVNADAPKSEPAPKKP